MGSGETGVFSRIIVVLKVILQFLRFLLTVSYRKNGAAGCITFCSPNNFVGLAAAPGTAPMDIAVVILHLLVV